MWNYNKMYRFYTPDTHAFSRAKINICTVLQKRSRRKKSIYNQISYFNMEILKAPGIRREGKRGRLAVLFTVKIL